MNTGTLIIAGQLIGPPTDSLAFREVTAVAHRNLHLDVLIQTSKGAKDSAYHWLKPKGLMDYIEYLLDEDENEDGIRIDVIHNFPRTIVVSSIRFENQLKLLGQLKWLSTI